MKRFYVVEPEVAGGLGARTVMDASIHPPVVSSLHYVFDGWLGDEMVESFPCFLVTESLSMQLTVNGMSGIERAEADISVSDAFREAHPDVRLPRFVWLRIVGQAGRDDFGIAADFRLVVSESALRTLQSTNPAALDVKLWASEGLVPRRH